MFAMKYMNKRMCARQAAISNVVRELDMLTRLDHPFLVNLWYAFQVSQYRARACVRVFVFVCVCVCIYIFYVYSRAFSFRCVVCALINFSEAV